MKKCPIELMLNYIIRMSGLIGKQNYDNAYIPNVIKIITIKINNIPI